MLSQSTTLQMSLGHFYVYCMYMFMCACVHVCMYVQRSEVDVSITLCFWSQDLSPNLELLSLLRLTSLGASADPIVSPACSPSPALGLQCPVVVILEIQTWVPMLARVALYQVGHHLTDPSSIRFSTPLLWCPFAHIMSQYLSFTFTTLGQS